MGKKINSLDIESFVIWQNVCEISIIIRVIYPFRNPRDLKLLDDICNSNETINSTDSTGYNWTNLRNFLIRVITINYF